MDIATAPSEYLEAELVAHAAFEATGMARMLDVLAEFDRRRGWESWGCASPQQWLGWKCGLGYGAASERLRVARALTVLPHTRDGLSRGKLSYSKVRELTRIATPDTDQCLAEIAGCATATQVATMVRQLRKRTPRDVARQVESRGLRWEVDDSDGSMVFTLRLPTETGQAVAAAHASGACPATPRRQCSDVAALLIRTPACGSPVTPRHRHVHHRPLSPLGRSGPDGGRPRRSRANVVRAREARVSTMRTWHQGADRHEHRTRHRHVHNDGG
jgi:hypothetical protein